MASGRVLRAALLGAVAVCFALGYGLNYGKSNQAFYLLGSVKLLHPELWVRDFVAGTRDSHPVFTLFGALLLRLDASGWIIGLCNVASVCFGSWCLYRLARARSTQPHDAVAAFCLVLAMAAASRTNGAGDSYVFGDIFQPSTLGSVGLLSACLAFVVGRPLLAGLGLALAGAFHVNYLLLSSCVLGVAWLVAGERRFRDGLFTLGPAGLVLLGFVPLLLASSDPVFGSEARRIFQEVRLPHHFLVARFARDFLPFVGFSLLGAAALYGPARGGDEVAKRWLSLLFGFALLILPLALLCGLLVLRSVNGLFAWRIAPHATIVAQVAFACGVMAALREPAALAKDAATPARAAFVVGVTGLLTSAIVGASRTACLIGVTAALLAALRSSKPTFTLLDWFRKPSLLSLAALVTFLATAGGPAWRWYARSDLLGARDTQLEQLCAWVASSTPRDVVLLSPPDEGEIRFRCRRAVVVDWKSPPVVPQELLEWARRIEDVTGRKPLRGSQDLTGYETLDESRIEELRRRYGVDVVIAKAGTELASKRTADFKYGRFHAFKLR